MTIKPNYLLGFLKVATMVSCQIFLFFGVVQHFRGESVDWFELSTIALVGGAFLGVGVCIVFTPRQISWDQERFFLGDKRTDTDNYTWQQLEAYGGWCGRYGTFLIKFEGSEARQIVPICFRAGDWRAFQSHLRTHFPDKRAAVWLGPKPVRFGRK